MSCAGAGRCCRLGKSGCSSGGYSCSSGGYRLNCSPGGYSCSSGGYSCSSGGYSSSPGGYRLNCSPGGYCCSSGGYSSSPGGYRLNCSPGGYCCLPEEESKDAAAEAPTFASEQPNLGAYFVIPPNPGRRIQLQKIANKELEDLAKWKEQHRPGLIALKPQKLGGRASEAEVREKQQLEHFQAKFKQKLKREDYERDRREAEEAEILKKKAIQRKKANNLEEMRRQQMLREHHSGKTSDILSRLDLGPYHSTSCSSETVPWAQSRTDRPTQKQDRNRMCQATREEQRKVPGYFK